MRIKISTNFPDYPLLRQTPGGKGKWEDCEFFIGNEFDECDFWVVFEGLAKVETMICPKGNTLFIAGEPPSVKWYNPLFLRQFQQVLTCHRNMVHRNVICSQPPLPWRVGVKFSAKENRIKANYDYAYDDLKVLSEVKKDRTMSVITSDKAFTKGHQERLRFVRRLESVFGDDIDVFITSKSEMEDKWDAVGRYRYHIAIESLYYPNFWTEKLADPLLALSHPFYYGCPNLESYFSHRAFTRINIKDLDSAIATIRNAIDQNVYTESLSAMEEAKSLILNKYNLFPTLAELCHRLDKDTEKTSITIKPETGIPILQPLKIMRRLLGGFGK